MKKVNYKKSLKNQEIREEKSYLPELISVIVLALAGLYFAGHILWTCLR